MKASEIHTGFTLKFLTVILTGLFITQGITGQAWYDSYWDYRIPVTITNSGSELTEFQVQVSLDASFPWSHANGDGSDLRFTSSDGETELSYWIENWTASTSANVWVKVPSVAASPATTTIYLYYGNSSVQSSSNGFSTFEFFDDFTGGTIDAARWTASGGTWSVVSTTQQDGTTGYVAQGIISSAGKHLLKSAYSGTDYIVEGYGQLNTGRVWGLGVRSTTNQSTYTLNLYEDLDAADNLYYYAWLGGPTTTTVYRGPVGAINLNTWYKLKVKASGNTFDIYFNDELKTTASNSQWASGSVGLFLEYDEQHGAAGTAVYNDIRVRKYASDEPTSIAGDEEEENPYPPLNITYTKTDVSCNGNSNGAIDITVTGGSGIYTYLWSNGQTTQDISGLSAGAYSVHADDGTGITGNMSIDITEPAALVAGYSITEPFDCDAGTATIQITATGGTGPYSGTGTFVQLPGTTSYSVTDAHNCQSDISVTIDPAGSWFDPAWAYRDLIDISNPGVAELTEFQVKVTLDGSFDFELVNDDGSDIRFTTENGATSIPFWIETWDKANTQATIWVRVPYIPSAGTTVYLYYGNTVATDVSNGDSTFEFFDDFSSSVNELPGYYEFGPASTIMVQDQVWETSAPHSLSVVKAPDGAGYTYYGYYGPQASGWIAIAGSDDLVSWTKLPSPTNPLISGNAERWPSVYLNETEGIYYMVHTVNYGGPSYLVYRTSNDGLSWSPPTTIIQDSYNNQNPSLFHDPVSGNYYLYWYRGEGGWRIMAREFATVAGLVSAGNEVLIISSTTLAAPQVLYYDNTYFLSTEIYNGEWQLRIYSGTDPLGPFTVLPGNPVLTGGCACLFQHLFGNTIYEYYCKLTSGTWTLDMRVVDPSTGRIMYEQGEINGTKWTPDGGTWSVVSATQQDGTTGNVAQGVTTASQILKSSFSGSDYIMEGYGRQIAGRVWGLGTRTTNRLNIYSLNLYENLDNDLERHNFHFYTWNSGSVTQDVFADLGVIDLNTWYKLTVKAHGSDFDLYFNDVFQTTATDPTFASGAAALYGESGTTAQFNDIRVRKYAATEPVVVFGTESNLTGQWTGAVSNDWNDPLNWRTGLPGGCSAIRISPGSLNNPSISGPDEIICYSLTISDGSALTVGPAGALTVKGALVNNGVLTIGSTLSSSGSLIVDDTSTGLITYNRQLQPGAVAEGNWHLVSAPVQNNTETNATKISAVYQWSETTGSWNTTSITSSLPGHGYNLRQNVGSDGLISFTGSLVNGDILFAASSPYADAIGPGGNYFTRAYVTGRSLENPGGKGWNLLGNPYASAIVASEFIDANYNVTPSLSQFDPNYVALYLFDGTQRRYFYIAKSTGWPGGGELSETHVQAGQGFFVLAMNDNSEFLFTRAMQEHSTGTNMLKSAGTDDRWPGLQLKVNYGTGESMTTIVYNSEMTAGLDPGYDIGLFSSGQDIEVYTTLALKDNSVNFTRQALPVSGADTIIVPVGIDSEKGGEVTLSADLAPLGNYKFWLEDRTAAVFTNLNSNSYTVTLPANTYGTGRFFIIASTNMPTGINADPDDGGQPLRIWMYNDQVIIKGETSNGAICEIFDINGRKVLMINLNDGELNTVDIPEGIHGVVLVRVTDGVKVTTRKIAIL